MWHLFEQLVCERTSAWATCQVKFIDSYTRAHTHTRKVFGIWFKMAILETELRNVPSLHCHSSSWIFYAMLKESQCWCKRKNKKKNKVNAIFYIILFIMMKMMKYFSMNYLRDIQNEWQSFCYLCITFTSRFIHMRCALAPFEAVSFIISLLIQLGSVAKIGNCMWFVSCFIFSSSSLETRVKWWSEWERESGRRIEWTAIGIY